MKKVAVGSKNPVKVNAVKLAFEKVFPDEEWIVEGIEVSSDVSAQPMSDEESIRGAKNRATKALKALSADIGVGIEGGLQKMGEYWFDCGWMFIVDKKGKEGIGSTIRMHTPKKMMDLIHAGKELGEVCDIVFKRKNSKHAEGQFGLMTNKHITRTSGYVDGVIIALASFLNPELFEQEKDESSMGSRTRKQIITICASASHYKNVLEIEKELKKMGFRVKVPKTARTMRRTNNFDVSTYKTWYNDSKDYKKKTELIKAHFKKVLECDAILVANFEKNGLEGYIGGNALMEMTLAFHYKKPIFIYNPISKDLSVAEEIYGMNPIFINSDLTRIKLK